MKSVIGKATLLFDHSKHKRTNVGYKARETHYIIKILTQVHQIVKFINLIYFTNKTSIAMFVVYNIFRQSNQYP